MVDLVQIYASNPSAIQVSKTDTYGGVQFTITEGYELRQMMDWYKKYNEQLIKESKAREQFESVAAAYESYQTALKLVLDLV